MTDIQTIHKYYFAKSSGRLLGLIPNSAKVVTIDPPFLSFNSKTRILTTDNSKLYLPENQAEGSKNPNLFEYTKDILSGLSN